MTRWLGRLLLAGLLAVPVSEAAATTGYLRLDFQRGSELRFGVFAPVSRTVAVLPTLRASGIQSELNLGVTGDAGALHVHAWVAGGLRYTALTPYAGPGLSFVLEVPPLPLYIESWSELRLFQPFGGPSDELLHRSFVLLTMRPFLSVGGQVEPTVVTGEGVQTNYVGPRANLGFGRDAIGLFAGWDTQGSGVFVRATLMLRFGRASRSRWPTGGPRG
jgi:hypothetical protein